jgi:phage-related protein
MGCKMNWEVEYYQKENGEIPVLEFLLSLNPKMRAKAYSEIELLQKHGTFLREPYVKSIKGDKFKGLFELRIKFGTDITRIFYFTFRNNMFVLLHGFIKKSDKTPERELERAKRYKEDYEKRCEL